MKIVHLHEYSVDVDRLFLIKGSFGYPMYFLKVELGSGTFMHKGIVTIHPDTKKVERIAYSQMASLVSDVSYDHMHYFGIEECIEGQASLTLKKLDLKNHVEHEVCTMNLSNKESVHFGHSKLISINHRYALLFHSPGCSDGSPGFFDSIFLLDSAEKKYYPIDTSAHEELKYLLDYDEEVVHKTKKGVYLIFKTGRIRPFEKREIWENKPEGAYHVCETIQVFELEPFVQRVKSKAYSGLNSIIQSIDYLGALIIRMMSGDQLIIEKQDFELQCSEIIRYDLDTKQSLIRRISFPYSAILYNRNELRNEEFVYGILHDPEHKTNSIYDIEDQRLLHCAPFGLMGINKVGQVLYYQLGKEHDSGESDEETQEIVRYDLTNQSYSTETIGLHSITFYDPQRDVFIVM